jgi:hypothetical protein
LRWFSFYLEIEMKRRISKMTDIILSQPAELTNREVADKLKVDIDSVRNARRRHGVPHNIKPRDRGIAARIAMAFGASNAKAVAAELGCSAIYVRQVWRGMRNG